MKLFDIEFDKQVESSSTFHETVSEYKLIKTFS